jgi:hypothetical protein
VLSQELIKDCTTWQTVSWIKIKYLGYEKMVQVFSFVDVTVMAVGLTSPDIETWMNCAKNSLLIMEEKRQAFV